MKSRVTLLAFPQDASRCAQRRAACHPAGVGSSTLEGSDHVERALPGADNDEVASLRHYTLAKQEVAAAVRATKGL
jgi:hypothetical protein